MLVMPSTAVIVSQPLTSRFCTVVKYDNGSLDDSINVKKCSPILEEREIHEKPETTNETIEEILWHFCECML